MDNFNTYFLTIFLMKTGMILALLMSSLLVTAVSAAEMTDGAMMKKNTMMMSDTAMNRMSVTALAKQMGYTWSRDRVKLATMAGVTGYRGTVKQNLAIRSYLVKSMKMKMTDGAMMKHDESMMKKEDAMMKKDEGAMMKKDETTMMKKEAGMYTAYSASAVTASLAAGKSVSLFFHATWCPGCRALDTVISGDLASIPAGSVIYKVDYDTNEALRQQYGVTSQHTVVKLNSDGTGMKKVMGPTSVMGIMK